MRNRWQAYFELVRLPNLFTAAADVLAGFFFAGGAIDEWPVALRLCLASMCLYAGGVALNDVCDAAQDASERPTRPIPSGRIARVTARRLSMALLLTGVAIASSVSTRSAVLAAATTASIVLYDAVFKKTPLGPALMGLCRALNLSLGLFAFPSLSMGRAVRPMAFLWVYVASVTVFAHREAGGGSRVRLAVGGAGVCAAAAGLWTLRWSGYNARYGEFQCLAVALLALVAVNGAVAWRRPTPERIQGAVKRYVLLLIVFDACLAWVSAGPWAAAGIAALLIPTLVCARRFRVT